jgi:hypothetical protein
MKSRLTDSAESSKAKISFCVPEASKMAVPLQFVYNAALGRQLLRHICETAQPEQTAAGVSKHQFQI